MCKTGGRDAWIEGAPDVAPGNIFSNLVEATNFIRTEKAHYRTGDFIYSAEMDEEIWWDAAWVGEDYDELDWVPTHWRPIQDA